MSTLVREYEEALRRDDTEVRRPRDRSHSVESSEEESDHGDRHRTTPFGEELPTPYVAPTLPGRGGEHGDRQRRPRSPSPPPRQGLTWTPRSREDRQGPAGHVPRTVIKPGLHPPRSAGGGHEVRRQTDIRDTLRRSRSGPTARPRDSPPCGDRRYPAEGHADRLLRSPEGDRPDRRGDYRSDSPREPMLKRRKPTGPPPGKPPRR